MLFKSFSAPRSRSCLFPFRRDCSVPSAVRTRTALKKFAENWFRTFEPSGGESSSQTRISKISAKSEAPTARTNQGSASRTHCTTTVSIRNTRRFTCLTPCWPRGAMKKFSICLTKKIRPRAIEDIGVSSPNRSRKTADFHVGHFPVQRRCQSG